MMTKPNIHGAAAAAALDRDVAATEEQAKAILRTARRAVEEKDVGGAGKLSMKRSMKWFLEGREKNKALRRHRGNDAGDA
jgi:hypothetical protein